MPKKRIATQEHYVTPWYVAPDKIKTNAHRIHKWVYQGWDFAGDRNDGRRSLLKINNTKLEWDGFVLAEHFEHHIVIYPFTDKSLYDIERELMKALRLAQYSIRVLDDDDIAREKQEETEHVLDEIFG